MILPPPPPYGKSGEGGGGQKPPRPTVSAAYVVYISHDRTICFNISVKQIDFGKGGLPNTSGGFFLAIGQIRVRWSIG